MLETLADGAAELILAEPVRTELQRILDQKFGLDQASTEAILGLLDELAIDIPRVPEHVEAVSGDPDDDRILAAVVAAGAEILISGDTRHMLPLGRHQSVRIVRPQAFLAEIHG